MLFICRIRRSMGSHLPSLCLLIIILHNLLVNLVVIFFIRAKLVNGSAHLLNPNLLLLFFHNLDALLSLIIECLGLTQLVTDHVEIALHRID